MTKVKMKKIGETTEFKNKQNIILKGFDPVSAGGFTQVPNVVLENEKLSSGAKLCYSMLLKYAWTNNYVYPGQERLAKEMGVGKRSVVRFLKELEEIGYLEKKRRGQGQTNIYILHCRVKK